MLYINDKRLYKNDNYSSILFQAEDGIRDLVRSRGLGDVYKRQHDKNPGCRRRSGPGIPH